MTQFGSGTILRHGLLLTGLFLITGCATKGPKQLYEGPPRAEADISRITCERQTNAVGRFAPPTFNEVFLISLDGQKVGPVQDAHILPGVHEFVFEPARPNANTTVSQQGGLVGALIASAVVGVANAAAEERFEKSRGKLSLGAAMGEQYVARFYKRGDNAWYWIERSPDGLLVAGQKKGPAFYKDLSVDEIIKLYRDEPDSTLRMDMLGTVTNQLLHIYAAENEPDEDVRHIAVRDMTDQSCLQKIALNEAESYTVRGEAIIRLEEPTALENLAFHSKLAACQRDAKHRLKYLSRNGSTPEIRQACAQIIDRLVEAKQWD